MRGRGYPGIGGGDSVEVDILVHIFVSAVALTLSPRKIPILTGYRLFHR